MKRFISLILSVALVAALAPAQRGQFKSKSPEKGVVHTTAELAYVKVRRPDGSYSISRGGGTIPITVRAISAEQAGAMRIKKLLEKPVLSANIAPPLSMPALSPAPFATTTYMNDSGVYYVADSSPSVLDDLTITPSGTGQAWKIITFGVHLTTSNRSGKFLVRYRGYETYVGGQGPGVSAFDNEFMDWGFYLNRSIFEPDQTTFLVTGDLTLNPIAIVPNVTCFMAQQFREPHPGGSSMEDGEGPFTDVWNVFSVGPQIGSSEDLFWYDSPPDGIYDETEPDNFGEAAPGAGNFLFNIEVGSGNTTTLNPFAFQWVRGFHTSGTIGSLWFDDQSYMVGRAGPVLFPNEPPAQLQVETFSPTFTPTGIRVDADAKVNTPGLGMRIEMYNFASNTWVLVYTGAAATTDVTGIGFAPTPAEFVQTGTGVMRAKVSFYKTGLTLLFPWSVSVDMVKWTVTNS